MIIQETTIILKPERKMKQYFNLLLIAVALCGLSASPCRAQQYTEPYLTDETRPNGLNWLPDPPELTSAAFTYDFYYYQLGRQLREVDGVGELALSDESAALMDVFSEVLGINLSYETTPEIVQLAERATNDAHKANSVVKKHYQRVRPFAQFKEPSLKPETDEEEAATYSYPSGHSSRGWMYALALASVAPECAENLFLRAHAYANNRVICGHHWKSDTDASLMLAAGIFATVVSTDEYRAQLVKAREEYLRLKGDPTAVRSAQTRAATGSAAIFDLQGRRLDTAPTAPGIYITDGQKKAVK